MSWSKIIAVTTVFLFILGMAIIDSAMAGEKMKWHGASWGTNWQQIEVGDEEGHVLAIAERKSIHINENTGERSTSDVKNHLDINLKTGQGNVKGYGVSTFPNGDKIVRTHEGKPVGKGHWRGTWKYIKGTGKYEGIKGSGTWDSYSMGRGQPSYLEVEGDVEMPAQ